MRPLTIALTLAACIAAGPAAAADKDDAWGRVKQFVDAFNKGDAKAAVATCADQAVVIDEFAPYLWSGADACGRWAADFDADAKKRGVEPLKVTLGKARHVDVVGDRAYVVAPASYSYKLKGKPRTERGATMTLALQKSGSDWKIVAWSWSKP